jgi:trigger factor
MYHVEELSSAGLKREYRVSFSLKDLRDRFEGELNTASSQAHIRGFRPGKVPKNHIRRLYGRSIMSSLIEQILSESVQNAIKEKALRPASPPTLSETEMFQNVDALIVQNDETPLSYVFSLEVLPSIELQPLSVSLVREECPVTDEEISEVLLRMLEKKEGFSPIDSAVDWENSEDYAVTVSCSGTVDGNSESVFDRKDCVLFPGRTRLFSWDPEEPILPGLSSHLIGIQPQEERIIKIALTPDQVGLASFLKPYVGKTIELKVIAEKVEKRNPIQLNDELAQSFGLESLDALKNDVRQRLEEDRQNLARERLKHHIFKALNETYTFDVPDYLIAQDAQEVGAELNEYKDSQEAASLLEDPLKKRRLAEQRVRLSLVLAEIGTKNDVKVSDSEIMQFLFAMSGHRLNANEIVAQCRKHPHLVHGARASLFEGKVLDHLITELAPTTKTVSREELLTSLEVPFEDVFLTPTHSGQNIAEGDAMANTTAESSQVA